MAFLLILLLPVIAICWVMWKTIELAIWFMAAIFSWLIGVIF